MKINAMTKHAAEPTLMINVDDAMCLKIPVDLSG